MQDNLSTPPLAQVEWVPLPPPVLAPLSEVQCWLLSSEDNYLHTFAPILQV